MVADDPVEDPPRLLRVDLVHVDRVRVRKGVLNLALGDGVEDHPLGFGGVDPQLLGQMPRNRLALAVEVRREPDVDGLLGCPLQCGHRFLLLRQDDVGRLEVVVQVHAGHRLLRALLRPRREIAHMTDRGLHHVVWAEVPVDRLRLGRRLDDHQMLARDVDRGAAATFASGLLG